MEDVDDHSVAASSRSKGVLSVKHARDCREDWTRCFHSSPGHTSAGTLGTSIRAITRSKMIVTVRDIELRSIPGGTDDERYS